MTNNSDNQPPTTEALLKAAIKAQHNQAVRELGEQGLHDLIAALPKAEQRTVMGLINQEK